MYSRVRWVRDEGRNGCIREFRWVRDEGGNGCTGNGFIGKLDGSEMRVTLGV